MALIPAAYLHKRGTSTALVVVVGVVCIVILVVASMFVVWHQTSKARSMIPKRKYDVRSVRPRHNPRGELGPVHLHDEQGHELGSYPGPVQHMTPFNDPRMAHISNAVRVSQPVRSMLNPNQDPQLSTDEPPPPYQQTKLPEYPAEGRNSPSDGMQDSSRVRADPRADPRL